MKKKMERGRRGWFLWIGGACFLIGSLVTGSVGLASSAANGPSVSGTVSANQGTPGSSPWPVSGTVGVTNFPSSTKIDPSGNSVTITAQTSNLGSGSVSPSIGNSQATSPIDVSGAKEIRVIVQCTTVIDVCSGSSVQVSFGSAGGLGLYPGSTFGFTSGVVGGTETESATFDLPGGTVVLTIFNGSGTTTSFAYEVDGRAD